MAAWFLGSHPANMSGADGLRVYPAVPHGSTAGDVRAGAAAAAVRLLAGSFVHRVK